MSARRRSDSPRELLDDQGRPIHERIRQLRTERGLTAAELARRADISPAYVTRIEKGEKVPGEEVAVKIAKILGDDPELYLWWVHGRFISDPERTLSGFRKIGSPETPASAAEPNAVAFLRSDPRELEQEQARDRERAERNRTHLQHEIEKHGQLLKNLSDQRERLEHEVERQEETLERISPVGKTPRALRQPAMARLSRRLESRARKLMKMTESEPTECDALMPQLAEDIEEFAGAMPEGPSLLDSAQDPFGPIRVRLYDNAAESAQAPEWMWLDRSVLPEGVDGAKVVAHRLGDEDAAHLGDLDAGDVVVVARGFNDPPDPERIYLVAATHETAATGRSTATRLTRVRLKDDKLLLISEGERTDVEIIDLTPQRSLEHWLLGKVVAVIRSAPGE